MEWYINVNNCVVLLCNFHTRLHIITLSYYISVCVQDISFKNFMLPQFMCVKCPTC